MPKLFFKYHNDIFDIFENNDDSIIILDELEKEYKLLNKNEKLYNEQLMKLKEYKNKIDRFFYDKKIFLLDNIVYDNITGWNYKEEEEKLLHNMFNSTYTYAYDNYLSSLVRLKEDDLEDLGYKDEKKPRKLSEKKYHLINVTGNVNKNVVGQESFEMTSKFNNNFNNFLQFKNLDFNLPKINFNDFATMIAKAVNSDEVNLQEILPDIFNKPTSLPIKESLDKYNAIVNIDATD